MANLTKALIMPDGQEYEFVGKHWFGVCSTASSTTAKSVSITGFSSPDLVNGTRVSVKFSYGYDPTSGSMSLNVNSTGAKSVYIDTYSVSKYEWSAGTILDFVYYNGSWYIINGNHASTASYGKTILTNTISSNSTSALTPKAVYDAGYVTASTAPVTSVNTKTGAVSLTASDVGALPDSTVIPTKTSDLTNDSGYVTTDTKNTAGSTNTTSKIYLVGATSQAANPQTYSNSKLYYTRSSGLYSEGGNDDNFSVISQSGRKIDLSVSTDNTTHTPKVTVDETGVYIGDTTVSSSTITLNSGLWWSDSDNYVRVKNLIAPTNNTDAATKKYVDDSIPTNVSSFTNDVGYITSADVPEGSSAYTGTISAVSTTASSGTNNGFARGDHVHNITKTTIDTTLGTGSGTTKFYREDGSWATPNYTTNTDTKVSTAAVTSGTTYYPTIGTDTTSAATKYYDKTGITYAGTNGTANGTNGNALLTLGNNTASTSANWKKGTVRLYGTTAYYTDLVSGAPSANRTITFPNSTGTVALTGDIPLAGTSASAVGATASGGSATTWSKSDHIHSISSSTITSALGYTPYNSTNPNGYTTNTGTVTKVTVGSDLKVGTTAGGNFTTSGTISHANSVTAKTTQGLYPITFDAQGHVTGAGDAVTIPTVPTNVSAFTNDAGYITSDSDTKVSTAAVTSGTTYYPTVGSNTTSAATKYYDSTGFTYKATNGTANGTNGEATITLGNSTASTSSNWKQGKVVLYGTTAYATTLLAGAPSAARTITFPNATGTVALTSDIPTVPDVSGKIDTAGTGLSKSGTTLNHSNSVTAQTTQAVYPIKIDAQGHISAYGSSVTIPSITLNGSSTTSPSFYAPTGAGTSGQYLKSSGSGAPTWTNFPTIPSITLNGSSTTSPSFYAPTGAGTSGQYLKSSGSGAPTWTNFPTIPSITLNGSSSTSPSFYAPTGAGTSGNILKSSGTGAPTWSSLSSSDVTTALGYTPYNSTNPNGYTSNTGTVTGVKVNGTTIDPTSGVVDIGTVAESDTKVTQTSIISNTSDSTLDHNYRLVLSGQAGDTTETNTVYKADTLRFNPYQARLFMEPSNTAVTPVFMVTNSDNYMDWLTAGSNWFNVNGTSTSTATAGIRLSQSGNSPYIEIFDDRSTATGDGTYRLFASGIKKVNNFANPYHVAITGSAVSLNNTNFNVTQSFTISKAGTYLVSVMGMFPALASSAIKIVRLTSNTSTDAISAACEATLPSTVAGNLNKVCFTAIVNLDATTYRIQMKTASATNGSGYSAYSYVRLL